MDITPQKVLVVDAQGAAPTIPFWKGDQIGRTYELGMRVNQLYDELRARLDEPGALEWLRRRPLVTARGIANKAEPIPASERRPRRSSKSASWMPGESDETT